MKKLYFLEFLLLFFIISCNNPKSSNLEKPNILWITTEDISQNLGCYGDKYVHTPNLDAFASQGVQYNNMFSTAPVCAPARSSIITGMYSSSIGSHHMRCSGKFPEEFKYYPQYLREAGYYCTNNSKEDYNLEYNSQEIWDESSKTAHWRNRNNPSQPFFAIFNLLETHESKTNRLDSYIEVTEIIKPDEFTKPGNISVPPYFPDTEKVRELLARYYSNITAMDKHVAKILQQLEEDGLSDNTIVMFYSDNGAGLPRAKRWLYDSGLKVPLMVYAPEKYKHLIPYKTGTTTDELVSFIDLAPTVLNLAGIEIPENMQGRAFLGENLTRERRYIYAGRDRMDERYDMQRVVREKKFKYIRYYESYKPYIQYMNTPEKGEIMKAIRSGFKNGALPEAGMILMADNKPFEVLYDTYNDPYELNNLADNLKYQDKLKELSKVHEEWIVRIYDVGLIPETIIRSLEEEYGKPIYNIVREQEIPVDEIQRVAFSRDIEVLVDALDRNDASVRYWGAIGLGNFYHGENNKFNSKIEALGNDKAPVVRIAGARALCKIGKYNQGIQILTKELKSSDEWVRLSATQVLDEIDDVAKPAINDLKAVMDDENKYVVRVVNRALNQLLGTDNKVE